MPDCPPPPVEDVAPIPDEPTVTLPRSVATWYEARDVYAVRLLACHHEQRGALTLVEAERDAAVWLAEGRALELKKARQRPSWGLLAGGVALGFVAGAGVVVWAR